MPFDLAVAVTGFVSGVIGGIVTFEYRHYREQQHALEAWYEKVEQIAIQVSQSADRCDDTTANQLNSWETCDDIGDRLRFHLSEAPAKASLDVFEESFELVRRCANVTNTDKELITAGSAGIKPKMEDAGEQARKTKNLASDARADIDP